MIRLLTPFRSGIEVASIEAGTKQAELRECLLANPDVTTVAMSSMEPLQDLEVVRGLDQIDRLTIHAPAVGDSTALHSIASTLVSLGWRVGSRSPLRLDGMTRLENLDAGYPSVAETLTGAQNVRHLGLRAYSEADLAALRCMPLLKGLSLAPAPMLETLRGLEESDLTSLIIDQAPKLGSLEYLPKKLENLDLKFCRNIGSIAGMSVLTSLLRLEIGECGEIDSLNALNGLPIENLAIWGKTNVMDGNLNPILELKALRTFRMDGKRHYRPRVQAVKTAIAERSSQPGG